MTFKGNELNLNIWQILNRKIPKNLNKFNPILILDNAYTQLNIPTATVSNKCFILMIMRRQGN